MRFPASDAFEAGNGNSAPLGADVPGAWHLLDAIPHLVWVTAPDGTVEYLNRQGRDYSGLTTAAHWQSLRSVSAANGEEVRIRKSDGTAHWFRWQSVSWPTGQDTHRIVTCTALEETRASASACCVQPEELAEKELRRSEKRYRSLVKALAQTVLTTNAEGTVVCLLGDGDLLTPPPGPRSLADWLEYAHPEDRAFVAQAWQAALADRSVFVAEFRARHANGEWRNVIGRSVPILDTNGSVEEWVGVVIDVTEQQRAKEQLAEANRLAEKNYALLDTLIQSSPVGIAFLDTQFRVLHINQPLADITGIPVEEYIGRPIGEMVPELWPRLGPTYRRLLETGEPVVNLDNTGTAVFSPGRVRHRLSTYFPVRLNGEIIGIGAMVIDITDRKEAEAELRRSEKRYRSLVSAVAHIVWTVGPDRTIRTVLGGEEFIESPEARLSVAAWREIMHPDDCARVQAMALPTEPGAGPLSDNLRLRRRDGQWRHAAMRATPVFDEEGKLEEWVGVTIDVTPQRQLEEQLRQAQKMEAVGQLAGGVAHDFNNLLTVINGYGEILLNQLPAEDRRRPLVNEIRKAGERARGLTRQLLAFSHQQIIEPPQVLNLNAVVEDAEQMLRRVIGEDVIFTSALAPQLWSIKASHDELHQVIMNLTVNARDAMPRGGQLTIETANVSLDEAYAQAHVDVAPGDYVLLGVTDTGGGMDDVVKARIFEPFFTTKGPGKGTGLGLATVYGIVRHCGGHINVFSEVGRGTCFKLYFPAAMETAPLVAPLASRETMPSGTETILLVEDEDAVRELAGEVLQSCGYTVVQAPNGREALTQLRNHPEQIDLLVSDVIMPYLGGRELAEQAATLAPGLRILFMSGYTDDAVVRHGVLKADFAFLQKPFTPLVLARKVREVLDQAPSEAKWSVKG